MVAEKLAVAFTSMSNVALANADVVRPKKTIARNTRAIISDAAGRRQLRVEVAEVCPICGEEAIFGGLDWT